MSALTLPTLRNTTPEDWDVDQVGAWLVAMGFENIADNFKGKQPPPLVCMMSVLFFVSHRIDLLSSGNLGRHFARTQSRFPEGTRH